MKYADLNKKDPYGRLLKREDIPKDSEHFDLQEYNWLEFSTEDLVFPDNPRASIVTKALHDPKELTDKVRIPGQFNKPFRAPLKPLFPVDLSDDYRKFVAESIQRRKRRSFDDDDTTTIDFSEISTPPDFEDRLSKWKSKGVPQPAATERESGASSPSELKAQEQSAGDQSFEMSPSEVTHSSGLHEQSTPLTAPSDREGVAETSRAEKTKKDVVAAGSRMRPASDISQAARDRIIEQLNARTGGLEDLPGAESFESEARDLDAEASTSPSQEFEMTAPSLESNHPLETSDEFETDSEVLRQSSQAGTPDSSNDTQESYKKGYDDAVRKFGELHKALNSAAQEIKELKGQILLEGRDIFVEILKLTAEEVLRKQIAISDDALSRVFQSTVGNLHGGGPLKVKAHPETVAKLKTLYADAKLPFESVDWVEDASLEEGDLKVQSSQEAARVDLRAIVSKKVDGLAREIFNPPESSARNPTSEGQTENSTNDDEDSPYPAQTDEVS